MDITFDLGWLKPSTMEELLEDARTMVDGAESIAELNHGRELITTLERAIAES